MPASKASKYPKWNHKFQEYWAIDDDYSRQQLLLSYFKQHCWVTLESTAIEENLTINVIKCMLYDDVFADPFALGMKSVHEGKNFTSLRQCILGEALFLCGEKKSNIGRMLVVRKTDRLKEEYRQQAIRKICGELIPNISTPMSPRSKYLSNKIEKKRQFLHHKQQKQPNEDKDHHRQHADDRTIDSCGAYIIFEQENQSQLLTTEERLINLYNSEKQAMPMSCIVVSDDDEEEEDNVSHGDIVEQDYETRHGEQMPRGVGVIDPIPFQGKHTEQENLQHKQSLAKFGLHWWRTEGSKLHDKKAMKPDTLSRKAKTCLTILNQTCGGQIEIIHAVSKKMQSKVDHIFNSLIEDDNGLQPNVDDEDKKSCNTSDNDARSIESNIRAFLELPQFHSKGRRDPQVYQTLLAIYTSMISPSHDYCLTPYGEGEVVAYSPRTQIYTINFPSWCGTMYTHKTILFDTFTCTSKGSFSFRKLGRMFGTLNYKMFKKCQHLRDSLSTGHDNPFNNIIFKPEKRWDNFDDEIRENIYKFCHDPDYVRPDNYCRDVYTCYDEFGQQCHHQRHNWMVNGNIALQHDVFLASRYFPILVQSIQDKYPERNITEDYIRTKASLRKFVAFKSNCVKDETRASCVDPIEAACYDVSRALQHYFMG
mmetsp:Transcript_12327/g.23096  ORF Transcript_12327/g.23096 Transcript_12327/m.23096 type:complete len:650 (-) Transcript_12327:2634-4583(-)